MDDDADAKMILTTPPPRNCKRPRGWTLSRGAFSCAGCLHAACAGARMAWRTWQANALNAPPA